MHKTVIIYFKNLGTKFMNERQPNVFKETEKYNLMSGCELTAIVATKCLVSF